MSKLTIKEFARRLPRMSDDIKKTVTGDWTKNTIFAGNEAKKVAPKKTGMLQMSMRTVKAQITPQGIKSAFIFGVPYALTLERGVREGKELHISTEVNPLAQKGYAKHGVKEYEQRFIDDLKKAVSISWSKL